jgi:hypothetical protein
VARTGQTPCRAKNPSHTSFRAREESACSYLKADSSFLGMTVLYHLTDLYIISPGVRNIFAAPGLFAWLCKVNYYLIQTAWSERYSLISRIV